ncbi:MAG: hypothetical protein ACRD5Z_12025 [Bryobacteraceae bacterium]
MSRSSAKNNNSTANLRFESKLLLGSACASRAEIDALAGFSLDDERIPKVPTNTEPVARHGRKYVVDCATET